MPRRKSTADRYEFGFARDLCAANILPRTALGSAGPAGIRQAAERGHGRKIMAAMRKKVRTLVDLLRARDDFPGQLKVIYPREVAGADVPRRLASSRRRP